MKKWLTKLASLYEETDARTHVRIPASFQATLSGPFGILSVTGVDGNRDGAGVQSDTPLAIGTLAFLKIEALGLMGFAHVRHCSPCDGGYRIGLKFRERLARDRKVDDDWTVQKLRRDQYRAWDESDA